MLQEAIYKFKASGPMLLPDLIDNYWIGETKAYEDYAILPYEVHIPQPIDKVLDMFEMNADLAILYHLEPTIETVFGHECCAYCYPVTERMFKINCKTSIDGLIHDLYLQPIITQYFIDNKSEIWLLFLIAHSKR